jgi:thiamine pyrophosphate-dependent acetolactate synthase large subunit-like protein
MGQVNQNALERREVVARLLMDRRDLVVVTGLGSASYDAMAAGDHDRNYYLWAAMGSAAMVGFGIANTERNVPVLVLTGDGKMMMGLGSLATIAVQKPKNLTIAVLDNGQFGETGMQVSHAGLGIAIDKVAASCGVGWTASIRNIAGVDDLRARIHKQDGLGVAVIKVATGNPPRVLPPRDGVYIKNRFRAALGHQPI